MMQPPSYRILKISLMVVWIGLTLTPIWTTTSYAQCVSTGSGNLLDGVGTFGDGSCATSSDYTISSGHTVYWGGFGSSFSGNITVQSGATLALNGSAATVSGTVILNGGTLDIDQGYTIATLSASGTSTIDIASTSALTVSNSLPISSGTTLSFSNSGGLTASAGIELSGGTLAVSQDMTITGSMAATQASTLQLDSALNTSASLNLGSNTVIISGNGGLSPGGNGVVFDQSGATLLLAGTGAINLVTMNFAGTIDANTNPTIQTLTLNASPTIDVASGQKLSISNATTLGSSHTMTFSNSGEFDPSGGFTVNGGTLNFSAATSISQVTVSGSTATLSASADGTISNLTLNNSLNLGVSDGVNFYIRDSLSLPSASTLSLTNTGKLNASGGIALNGGTLQANATTTISDSITVNSGSTLALNANITYSGSTINLGGNTLTVNGTGTFSNTNPIQLNNANSLLQIDGTNTINNVAVGDTDINSGKGITANESSTITTLTTANTFYVNVASSKTLSSTNAFTLDSGDTLNLTGGGSLSLGSSFTLNGSVVTSESSSLSLAGGVSGTGSLDISNGSLVTSGSVANTIALSSNSSSSITLNTGSSLSVGGSQAFALVLNGGTLNVSSNLSLSGNITHTESSVWNLNSFTTTYIGSEISIGSFTFTLSGAGSFLNTGAINLNNANSLVNITGASTVTSIQVSAASNSSKGLNIDDDVTITTFTPNASTYIDIASGKTFTTSNKVTLDSGANLNFSGSGGGTFSPNSLELNGGGISTSATVTFPNAITVSESSSINLDANLTYNGAAIGLGAFTLTFSGNGNFINTNALLLNATNSTLVIGGNGTYSSVQVNSTGSIQINGSPTISTLTWLGSSTALNITIASGQNLTLSNALSISLGQTFSLSSGSINFSGGITLAGGTLSVASATTISSDISVSASSTINLADSLIYNGSAIALGGNTLTLSGSGAFANTGALTLDNAQSQLLVSGPPTISSVSVTAASDSGFGLNIDANTTITSLTTTVNTHVSVASGITLTISNSTFTIPSSTTFTVSETGGIAFGGNLALSGSLDNSSSASGFTVGGSLTGSGSLLLNSGTLGLSGAVDSTISLSTSSNSVVTLNSGSSLSVGTDQASDFVLGGGSLNMTSNVALSGKITHTASSVWNLNSNTITYSGDAIDIGATTLTLSGAGTLSNTNAINLNSADSLVNITGAATVAVLTLSATANSGKGLDIDASATITTLNLNASTYIDIVSGSTLTTSSALSLGNGTTLTFSGSGGGTFTPGSLALNGGSLTTAASVTIASPITVSADSTISLGGDLTYTSNTITLGANSLTFSGNSNFANTNAIQLDNVDSLLVIGGNGTYSSVQVSADNNSGKGLDINGSPTITSFTWSGNNLTLDIASGQTLTIASALSVSAGKTLNLSNSGTLTTSGGIDLAGGTLSAASGSTITNNITQSASSTISISTAFNYTGTAILIGNTSLTFTGSGSFNNTNAITLDNANSELQTNGAVTLGSVAITTTSASGKGLNIDANTTLSSLSLSAGAEFAIASGTTLTISNDITISSGQTLTIKETGNLAFGGALTIDGTLSNTTASLSVGGNLDVNAATTFSTATTVGGSLTVDNTLTSSSSLSIAGNVTINQTLTTSSTLTFNGSAVSGSGTLNIEGATVTTGAALDGSTLTLQTNSSTQLTITANSTTLTSAPTFPITLAASSAVNGATLVLSGNMDITNTNASITISGNSTIQTSGTVNYSVGTLSVGANTLTFSGTGTFINSQAILLNDAASVLNLAGGSVNLVNVSVAGAQLDVDSSATIGSLTMTASNTLDIAANQFLTVTDAVTLPSGTVWTLNNTGGLIAPIVLNGGTLDVNAAVTLPGNISITADSIIDLAAGVTYLGGTINLGDTKLTIQGTGSFLNQGALVLNSPNSLLDLQNIGTVSLVQVGANSNTGQGIDVTNALTITTLTLNASLDLSIANGPLTVTNPITLNSGIQLNLTDSGTLIVPGGIVLNGGVLKSNSNVSVTGVMTISQSSTIDLIGNLTYDGPSIQIGPNVLTLTGNGIFTVTNPIDLNDPNSEVVLSGVTTDFVTTTDLNPGKGITISSDITLTGDQFLNNDVTYNIGANQTLTVGGLMTIPTGVQLSIVSSGALNFQQGLNLNGGVLSITGTLTIEGNISLSANSEMQFDGNVTYNGDAIPLGANTLTLTGNGNWLQGNITLNDANSGLIFNLAGDFSGTVNLLADAVEDTGTEIPTSGLTFQQSMTLQSLAMTASTNLNIDGVELTIVDALQIPVGTEVRVNGTEGSLSLNNALLLDGTLQMNANRLVLGDTPNTESTGAMDMSQGELVVSNDMNVTWQWTNETIDTLEINGNIVWDSSFDQTINNFTFNGTALTYRSAAGRTFQIGSPLDLSGGKAIAVEGGEFRLESSLNLPGGSQISVSNARLTLSSGGNLGTGALDMQNSTLRFGEGLALEQSVFTTQDLTLEMSSFGILSTGIPRTLEIESLLLRGSQLTILGIDLTIVQSVTLPVQTEKLSLAFGASLTLQSDFIATQGSFLFSGEQLTLGGAVNVGQGSFQVTGGNMSLANDLVIANGTLGLENLNSITLLDDITIDSPDDFIINTLVLNGNTLTLGSASADLVIRDALTLAVGEAIDAGAADITFESSVQSSGTLLSAGGVIRFEILSIFFPGSRLQLVNSQLRFSEMDFSSGANIFFMTGGELAGIDLSVESAITLSVDTNSFLQNVTIAPNVHFNGNIPQLFNVQGQINLTDRIPGIQHSPDTVIVTNDGSQVDLSIALSQVPQATVALTLAVTPNQLITFTPSHLTFQPNNWDLPQFVTITGLDDGIPNGDQSFQLIFDLDEENTVDPVYIEKMVPNFVSGVVQETNQAPVAIPSSQGQRTLEGSPVLLDGSKSSDADNDTLTYRWQPVCDNLLSPNLLLDDEQCTPLETDCSGFALDLTDEDTARAQFNAPAITLFEETFTFRLTVEDDRGRCNHALTTVTTAPSRQEVLGNYKVSIPHNSISQVSSTHITTPSFQRASTSTETQSALEGSMLAHTVKDPNSDALETRLQSSLLTGVETVFHHPDGASIVEATIAGNQHQWFFQPDGTATQVSRYANGVSTEISVPSGTQIDLSNNLIQTEFLVDLANTSYRYEAQTPTQSDDVVEARLSAEGLSPYEFSFPAGVALDFTKAAGIIGVFQQATTQHNIIYQGQLIADTMNAISVTLGTSSTEVISSIQSTWPFIGNFELEDGATEPSLVVNFDLSSPGNDGLQRTLNTRIAPDTSVSLSLEGSSEGITQIGLPQGTELSLGHDQYLVAEMPEMNSPQGNRLQASVTLAPDGQIGIYLSQASGNTAGLTPLWFPPMTWGTQVHITQPKASSEEVRLNNVQLATPPDNARLAQLPLSVIPDNSAQGIYLGVSVDSALPVYLPVLRANSVSSIVYDLDTNTTQWTFSETVSLEVGNQSQSVLSGEAYTLVSAVSPVPLTPGWNLVGVPTFSEISVADIFLQLPEASSVAYWNNSELVSLNRTDWLTAEVPFPRQQAGSGFYIQASETGNVLYPQSGRYDLGPVLNNLSEGWHVLSISSPTPVNKIVEAINFDEKKTQQQHELARSSAPPYWIGGSLIMSLGVLLCFSIPGPRLTWRNGEGLLAVLLVVLFLWACADDPKPQGQPDFSFRQKTHSVWKWSGSEWLAYSSIDSIQKRLQEAGIATFDSVQVGEAFWVRVDFEVSPSETDICPPPAPFESPDLLINCDTIQEGA